VRVVPNGQATIGSTVDVAADLTVFATTTTVSTLTLTVTDPDAFVDLSQVFGVDE